MSLFFQYPALIVNACALFVVLPGAGLLCFTRWHEQRQLDALAERVERTPFDEPMPFLGGEVRRVTRAGYGVGSTCLALALALSWASTHL